MYKQIKSFAIASFFILSASAQAALVEQDWKSIGDSLLTRDTSTNLEWLDLSLNVGRNYNSVFADLQAGGTYEGFRFATRAEYETLWAGTSFDHNNWRSATYLGDADEIARSRLLGSLVGYTYDTVALGTCVLSTTNTCYRENMGMLLDTDSNGNHWLTHMDFRDSLNDSLANSTGKSYWYSFYGNPNFVEGSNNYFDTRVSSWLVRDAQVPVPAPLALLGLGLLGIAFTKKRKA